MVSGRASGTVMRLDEALSFCGGVDEVSGEIIDRRHPQLGSSITGSVLTLPAGRGSSSSSSVLAETIRRGTGPAAIVLGRTDHILAVGALVAEELYRKNCPVVVVGSEEYERLRNGAEVEVQLDGTIFFQ